MDDWAHIKCTEAHPNQIKSTQNDNTNRAEVRALRSENSGLKEALAQAQEAVAAYDRDNKILKRGVAVQNGKIERGEAELESLRQGNRQALEHIGRLEQVRVRGFGVLGLG